MDWSDFNVKSILNTLKYTCSLCLCFRSCVPKPSTGHTHLGKTRISPAQIIPTKILTQIFIECTHPDLPIVYLPPKKKFYYPWRLGHICSHWRSTLWNSDAWSTIYVDTSDWDLHLILEMLDYILSQTTGMIDLSINQYSYKKSAFSDFFLFFSHRFRSLTVSPTPHHVLNTLLDLTPGSLNHLEALYIFNLQPNSPLCTPSNIGLRFRSLRELGISGDTPLTPYISHFPLSQLTHLSIGGCMVSPPLVHFLLKQCTSLIFADLMLCKEVKGTSQYRVTGPVTSPIERIDLAPNFDLRWNSLLEPLVLPSLIRFALMDLSRVPADLGPTFPYAMYSLVQRSKCSLEFFSLSSYFKPLPNLDSIFTGITSLLKTMPDLTTFVSGYTLKTADISAIWGLLTKLEAVDLKVRPDGLHIILDMLEDFISSPIRASRRFPGFINITCCYGNGFLSARARYLKNYKSYKDAGIDITTGNIEGYDMRFLDRIYID